MNEAILLYTVLAVIVGISLAFLAQAYHRRAKASPLEIGFYITAFVALAVFGAVLKQSIDIALDPGIAHPVAYNSGEGCNPDCLPDKFEDLQKQLGITR